VEVVESTKHILIVMENCAGGDLLHFVKKKGRLSETEAKIIFRQIIYGVRVCH
jgi:serine/threonine protein kinase